ncbi:MAG: UDP-4-amino-4,6-dideoxy-N-acetyl-beta-L-altrosamine transaminase [Bacteroidota bacterium]
MKPIPYGRQSINDQDIQAVLETLQADFLTQGPQITQFEEAFAAYVGAKYAVAVANGTAALHLCALTLDVKPNQKVITTPITFSASANCVRYCGGEVVFVDIDPKTYLLDINKVRRLLESSPKGTYHGVIPVDFAGRSVDMQAYRALANEFGLWIIEDACHAPGGYFQNQEGTEIRCGSGTYADLSIFSFHPVKHIATGEGGMVTTSNKRLYQRLQLLRTHGITKDKLAFQNEKELIGGDTEVDWPGWYMEMQELGFNYRLSDIHAALGLSQLRRASEGLSRRRVIAKRYAEELDNEDFVRGSSGFSCEHAYHLYVVEVEDRLGLYQHLRGKMVFPQVHYIPVHLMPYYQALGWKPGDFPNAEHYYSQCLSLPMYPSLTDEEQGYVIDQIKAYYS